MPSVTDLLAELVAMPTQQAGGVGGAGDEARICAHLAPLLHARGADEVIVRDHTRAPTARPARTCLRAGARRGGSINAHVDTVPANGRLDAFAVAAAHRRRQALRPRQLRYPRAAIAATLVALERTKPHDFGVLFSGDEEAGSGGDDRVPRIAARARRARAIVCEPTARHLRHRASRRARARRHARRRRRSLVESRTRCRARSRNLARPRRRSRPISVASACTVVRRHARRVHEHRRAARRRRVQRRAATRSPRVVDAALPRLRSQRVGSRAASTRVEHRSRHRRWHQHRSSAVSVCASRGARRRRQAVRALGRPARFLDRSRAVHAARHRRDRDRSRRHRASARRGRVRPDRPI